MATPDDPTASDSDALEARLRLVGQERDLYRRLLELGRVDDIAPFLRDALGLIVSVVGARQGYIELHADDDGDGPPRWWIGHGLTPEGVLDVRGRISRGIVAAAVAAGETVVTTSAHVDPRFQSRDSVANLRIEAVLCVPIGDDPPVGIVYLEGRNAPGGFSDADRDRAEVFARHVAPLAGRLLAEHRRAAGTDPLKALRETLRLDGVVGRSPALIAVLRQLALLAPLDVHVLLTGQSGTGKSQLARVLHDSGPRAAGPFVEVNCAALPEALLESELFGALPGAHSTASRRVDGKVAAAERGTLFLDEIGEMPLASQAKLLQLVQSRTYFPLGGSRAQRADVRVLAATNTDLERAVAERRFREDLLYRLQVMPVRVPSLAERREDVALLARHVCTVAAERHRMGQLALSRGALRAAELADWPGNVRQLEHAIVAAAIRAAGEGVAEIQTHHLFPDAAPVDAAAPRPTFQQATRAFQARLLREVLEETDWNVPEAARQLDLARSHAYSLIRVFGLQRDR